MKDNELNKDIEQLEEQIQYLQNNYKGLLQQQNTIYDLKTIRMQIKHAEESLRLKKRIRYIFLS